MPAPFPLTGLREATEREAAGMVEFRKSDGGREASGRRTAKVEDCVVRAAALLRGAQAGLDFGQFDDQVWGGLYDETFRTLEEAAIDGKPDTGMFRHDYEPIFVREFGFVKINLPAGPRPNMTDAYQRFGDCIVRESCRVK